MSDAVAIIPARGGSKRIHRKNIHPIDGVPAIVGTIKLAEGSNIFEKVIVSTDDSEIANIAISAGAEVNELRPSDLSNDFTTTLDVISYESKKLDNSETKYICCIYPLTPLLKLDRITQGYSYIREGNFDYVFPVLETPVPLSRSFTLFGEKPELVQQSNEVKRTQDLTKYYYDAGQFYFGTIDAWISRRSILNGNARVIPLDRWEVIDIDTPQDLELAKLLRESRDNMQKR